MRRHLHGLLHMDPALADEPRHIERQIPAFRIGLEAQDAKALAGATGHGFGIGIVDSRIWGGGAGALAVRALILMFRRLVHDLSDDGRGAPGNVLVREETRANGPAGGEGRGEFARENPPQFEEARERCGGVIGIGDEAQEVLEGRRRGRERERGDERRSSAKLGFKRLEFRRRVRGE